MAAGKKYRRVDFINFYNREVEYHTNINPENRNYENWKGMRVGDVLDGEILWKNEQQGLINADSKFVVIGHNQTTKQGDLFNEKETK